MKRAHQIRVGDMLPHPTAGEPAYRVIAIEDVVPSHVKVRVRYRDGGDGLRAWRPDQEVPIIETEDSTGPTAAEWVRP